MSTTRISALSAVDKKGIDKQLALVASHTDNVVIITDQNGLIEWVNNAFTKLTEYSLEEVIGRKPSTLLQGKNTDPATTAYMRQQLDKQQGFKAEVINYSKSGREYLLEINVQPIFADDGSIQNFIAIERDVSESSEILKLALEGGRQGLWHWNPRSAQVTLSKDFLGFFGYEHKNSSWIDGTLQAIVHPDEREAVKIYYRDLFDGGSTEAQIEYRIETASSEWRWILTKGRSVVDRDDIEKNRVIGIHTDITDSKHTESELRRLELERRRNDDRLRLAAVVERSSDAIVIIRNLDGKIEFVNNSFTEVTGYEPEEVLGKATIHLHTPKSAKEMYTKMLANLDEKGSWHGLVEWVCKDQRVIVIDKVVSPIFDENNYITSYVTVAKDVTYQQNLEKKILREQTLESIGFLAAGISHDFNNILNMILGYSEITQMDFEEDSQNYKNMNQVRMAVQRGREMVEQLLAFSKGEISQYGLVSLTSIVRETADLMRAGMQSNIALQIDIAADVPQINADPVKLRQVILNLATNAVHAMKESGGQLLIGLKKETVQIMHEMSVMLDNGDYICLTVRDTGTGMPPSVLERIYDPFFSTKEVGEGTGLGLSVVHGIIEEHGARIFVDSEVGKGTCFRVYFPIRANEGTSSQEA